MKNKSDIEASREKRIWINGVFTGVLIVGLSIISGMFFRNAFGGNFSNLDTDLILTVKIISFLLGIIFALFVMFVLIKFQKNMKKLK